MPITHCPGCLALETLVLALARRLDQTERRLAEVERRLVEGERRLSEPGALTLAGRHGQNGPPQREGPDHR